MKYTIEKMAQMLYWNKWISILMIVEITIGMSVFVYSLNLFYSLSNEEKERREQERDLVLEISAGEGDEYLEENPLTEEDYEKLQQITEGNTFLYIVIPQFGIAEEESYEFPLVLADYHQLDLEKEYSYWGEKIQKIMDLGLIPTSELQTRKMPEKLNMKKWKTEVEEIKLQDCVLIPITYMEQFLEDISSASIHVEWNSKELANVEETIQKIEDYLHAAHGKAFHYKVSSPEIELRNNGQKVKTSIQAINKAGLLFLAVFFVGMLAIFQLLFEHREEIYGVSLACGASYSQLFWEISLEIMTLTSIGTILGFAIGYIATYYIDFGIMIGYIKVKGDWRTILSGIGLYLLMTVSVSGIIYRKLKKQTIIRLLNGY